MPPPSSHPGARRRATASRDVRAERFAARGFRSRGVVGPALAWLAACSTATHTPRGHFSMEDPTGRIVEVALLELDPLARTAVADPTDLIALGSQGLCNGMSGAPVYWDGALVGVLVNVEWPMDPSQCFRYVPIDCLHSWADFADALLRAGAVRSPRSDPVAHDVVKPGELIGSPYLWGDFRMGTIGVVSEVTGDRISSFGHELVIGSAGPAERPIV